jgi:catechol-2,3-dioxygenase
MYIFADLERSGVSERRKTASEVRIGHVSLKVADLDRAISFYCDVLGSQSFTTHPPLEFPPCSWPLVTTTITSH